MQGRLLLSRRRFGRTSLRTVFWVLQVLNWFVLRSCSGGLDFQDGSFPPLQQHVGCDKCGEALFSQIVRLCRVAKSITSDCDARFLSHFWQVFRHLFDLHRVLVVQCIHILTGRTEVVDHTSGNLIRSICTDKPKRWCFVSA